MNLEAVNTDTPIVGVGTFPASFLGRLAQPGGNITGLDISSNGGLYEKMVQLLRDAVPSISRIAYFGPSDWWETEHLGGAARRGAEQLGLSLTPVIVDRPTTEENVRRAFAELTKQGFDAVYVSSETDLSTHHKTIAAMMKAAMLPAVTLHRQYARAGLLMSYTSNPPDLYRRAAGFVDRILKGEYPATMPIEQPNTFDFTVNLNTAKALGLTLPPKIDGKIKSVGLLDWHRRRISRRTTRPSPQ